MRYRFLNNSCQLTIDDILVCCVFTADKCHMKNNSKNFILHFRRILGYFIENRPELAVSQTQLIRYAEFKYRKITVKISK